MAKSFSEQAPRSTAKLAVLGALMGVATACASAGPQTPPRPTEGPEAIVLKAVEKPAVEETAEAFVHRRDETTTPMMTKENLLRQVLLNNPGLRADYAAFEAALQKAPQARSLPDPMFEYERMAEAFRFRDEMESTFRLSQTFPWFGKQSLMGRIAEEDAAVAFEDYRAAVLNAIRDASQAYDRLAFAYASYDLAREEKRLVGQFLESAAAAYASGRQGRQAVLKAQTELARIENELLGVPSEIRMLEAELNRLLGDPAGRALPRPAETALSVADLDREFLAEALGRRPELGKIDRLIEQSQLMQDLARKDYRPDVTLGLFYTFNEERDMFSGGEMDDEWGAMVGLNIPIPNARRRAQVIEARKMEEENRLRREELETMIAEGVESALARLRSLNDQLVVFEDSLLPLAQETFDVSQAEYTAGMGSFLDLLDAERTLLGTRRSYLQLVRDYRLSLADLERATGARIELEERAP